LETNWKERESEKAELNALINELTQRSSWQKKNLLDLKAETTRFFEERTTLVKELDSYQQSSHKLDLEKNRVKNRLELIKQSRESLLDSLRSQKSFKIPVAKRNFAVS
jgi:chromosome segregation ATPase